MHLLRTTTRTIDEAESAVDLGQTPGAIVFLSFSDSDLGLAAAALEDREGADVRLASLAASASPLFGRSLYRIRRGACALRARAPSRRSRLLALWRAGACRRPRGGIISILRSFPAMAAPIRGLTIYRRCRSKRSAQYQAASIAVAPAISPIFLRGSNSVTLAKLAPIARAATDAGLRAFRRRLPRRRDRCAARSHRLLSRLSSRRRCRADRRRCRRFGRAWPARLGGLCAESQG